MDFGDSATREGRKASCTQEATSEVARLLDKMMLEEQDGQRLTLLFIQNFLGHEVVIVAVLLNPKGVHSLEKRLQEGKVEWFECAGFGLCTAGNTGRKIH
jgi:hypothetical protein